MAKSDVIKALAVTAEMTGATFSKTTADALVAKLSRFNENAVLAALDRCCDELSKPVTYADIKNRIDDGRPSVETAWAMLPRDEAATVVMTEEMGAAWGLAREMMADGDMVAARMVFKEAYVKYVADARSANKAVKWFPSLGDDKASREPVLRQAVEKGLLPMSTVPALLPCEETSGAILDVMQNVELKLIAKQ